MSRQLRGDKSAASAAQHLIPLNDDSWETFILAIVSDLPDYENLFQAISSGTRQKFSVLQRGDVLSWASENLRNNDAAKEYKIFIDNGGSENDIPDTLLARLIKGKLLSLKEEGIEHKNALKMHAEEIENPPAMSRAETPDPLKSKGTKKPDHDKDRAKSSNKKTGKGSGKATEEVPAAETVKATVEPASKRKSKLRDRASKADAKSAALGDEPVDGPDVYYVLKDLNAPGLLNALMEETYVQVHAVLRLEGVPHDPLKPQGANQVSGPGQGGADVTGKNPTGSTLKLSTASKSAVELWAGPTTSNYRKYLQKSHDSSLWRQLVWTHVDASQTKDSKELFDVVAKRIYSILEHRKMYFSFYSPATLVNIPAVDKKLQSSSHLRYFEHLLSAAQTESSITVDVLLGILLEQVVRMLNPDEDQDNSGHDNGLTTSEEMGQLHYSLEKAMDRLIRPNWNAKKTQSASHRATNATPALHGDLHTMAAQQLDALLGLGINPQDLMSSIRSTYSMQRYQSVLNNWMKLSMADSHALAMERLLRKSEMLKFTSLSPLLFDHALLQFDFEKMLERGPDSSSSSVLDEYCWVEHFDAPTLVQVMQNAKTLRPHLKWKYCERTGKILLGLTGAGSWSKKEASNVTDVQVKTKVGFGLFCELLENGRQHLAPATPQAEGVANHVYIAGDHIIHHRDDSMVLYPSDGCHIEVHKVSAGGLEEDRYIALKWMDNVFRWGMNVTGRAYFTASFDDNAVFSIEQKAKGSAEGISVGASTADGLSVQFLPDGTIVQKNFGLPTRKSSIPSVTQKVGCLEERRLVTSDGSVIKYFEDGGVEILFPNGKVCRKNKTDSWTIVTEEGDQYVSKHLMLDISKLNELEHLASLQVVRENHPSLKKVVTKREDMVNVTIFADHTVVTEHSDGTVITCQGGADADENASAAALGRKVVDHSEFGTFSYDRDSSSTRVILPNKMKIERTAKSSSDKEVIYVIEKPQLKIQISNLGPFTFIPTPSSAGESTLGSERAINVYRGNWLLGTVESCDSSGNRFEVSSSGEAHVSASRILPKAVIPFQYNGPIGSFVKNFLDYYNGIRSSTKPQSSSLRPSSSISAHTNSSLSLENGRNPPRLFVISEDGSGYELIRDADMVPYFLQSFADPNVEIFEEEATVNSMALGVTVVTGGKRTANVGRQQGTGIPTYRQLVRYPPLTPQVRESVLNTCTKYQDFQKYKRELSDSHSVPHFDTYQHYGEERMFTPPLSHDVDVASKVDSSSQVKQMDAAAATFGGDRRTTTDAIKKLSSSGSRNDELERRTNHGPIEDKDVERQKPSAVAKNTFYWDFSSLPSAKPSPFAKSGMAVVVKKALLSGDNIPNYFDSPEGQQFFKQNGAAGRKSIVSPAAEIHPENLEDKPMFEKAAQGSVKSSSDDVNPTVEPNRSSQSVITTTTSPHKQSTDGRIAQQNNLQRLPPSTPGQTARGTVPNKDYLQIEATVRRKVNTSSTAPLRVRSEDVGKPEIREIPEYIFFRCLRMTL
ncbi:hypothetical protein HK102_007589 [Quaeritorhiza haematococci]|nr:hypothetical protein HK102_007589 [Quaeritorhiza haematococci]